MKYVLMKKCCQYIYIYIYARSTKSWDYIVHSSSFLMLFVIFIKRVYFRPLMSLHAYSNRFWTLSNHTGMVVPRAFHSCWKFHIQLNPTWCRLHRGLKTIRVNFQTKPVILKPIKIIDESSIFYSNFDLTLIL